MIVTPIIVGEDNAETADIVKELRSALPAVDGLTLQVTGGPAFGRRHHLIRFDGADFTLLIGDDPHRRAVA